VFLLCSRVTCRLWSFEAETTEEYHTQLENLKKNEKLRLQKVSSLEKSTTELRATLERPLETEDDLEVIAAETVRTVRVFPVHRFMMAG